MQGNGSVNLDIQTIIDNFANRIAKLTSDSVVNESIIAKLQEENGVLRKHIEMITPKEEANESGEPVGE